MLPFGHKYMLPNGNMQIFSIVFYFFALNIYLASVADVWTIILCKGRIICQGMATGRQDNRMAGCRRLRESLYNDQIDILLRSLRMSYFSNTMIGRLSNFEDQNGKEYLCITNGEFKIHTALDSFSSLC